MKKFMVMLGLLLSITGASFAQQKKNTRLPADEKMFELPPYITEYRAWANLGKGNIMQLELTRRSELERFRNIDSLLLVFFSDIKLLQDSLSDPTTAKRIDYLVDSAGHKKIRIRQTRPAAATYLVRDGEPAVLRLAQDTVFILLSVPPDKLSERFGFQRYDRLGFFLNDYEELNLLITAGLNHKVTLMETKVNGSWTQKGNRAWFKADPSISSKISPAPGTIGELSFRYHISIQNYKSYFTPSFELGMTIAIYHLGTVNTITADWEPVFLFAHDARGTLQTYRNDFLVIGYNNRKEAIKGFRILKGNGVAGGGPPAFHIDLDFSLGYLINRQGGYFTKHTFRLGAGTINLANSAIKIQPCMYFNNFLRGVTPGVRVTF